MSFYDLIHLADSSFVRAEPARKSGSGFIKMLKKVLVKENTNVTENYRKWRHRHHVKYRAHAKFTNQNQMMAIRLIYGLANHRQVYRNQCHGNRREERVQNLVQARPIFKNVLPPTHFFKVHAVRLRLQIVFLQAIYLQQPRRMTTSTYPNLNWHHVTYRHITWYILVVTWESRMANHLHQNNEFILSAIKIHFHSTFSSLILKI